MPATVSEVTYSDEEKVVPRSHMVKRQGCQAESDATTRW
jgi:hypothetical protein